MKDKIKNVFKNLTKDLKNKNKNRIALTMSIAAFIIAFSIVLQMKTVKEYKKANVEDKYQHINQNMKKQRLSLKKIKIK